MEHKPINFYNLLTMNKRIFVMYATVLLLVSCIKYVTVEDISGFRFSKINTPQAMDSLLIIDVRPHTDYFMGHIHHAINIPINELKARTSEISTWKKKPIYLYSSYDDYSFKAAEILAAEGFECLYNLEGIDQYHYPLDTIEVKCAASLLKDEELDGSVIIDYRTQAAYDEWHIDNAVCIPLGTLSENMHKFSKKQKIFIYSTKGNLCIWAVKDLLEAGFSNVCYIRDGTLDEEFKVFTKENIESSI